METESGERRGPGASDLGRSDGLSGGREPGDGAILRPPAPRWDLPPLPLDPTRVTGDSPVGDSTVVDSTAGDREQEHVAPLAPVRPNLPLAGIFLVLVNVCLYLLAVAWQVEWTFQTLVNWGAAWGPRVFGGEPWRLASSLFLSVDFTPLIFNSAALYVGAMGLEPLVGRTGMILTYTISGVVANLAYLTFAEEPFIYGNGGAVMGVWLALLAFSWFCPNARLRQSLAATRKSVLLMTVLTLALNLQGGLEVFQLFGSGMAAGFVCGAVLSRDPFTTRPFVRNLALVCMAAALITGWFYAIQR